MPSRPRPLFVHGVSPVGIVAGSSPVSQGGGGAGDFTLPTRTGVAHNTVQKASFTVSGFGSGKAISISGGSGQYRKNSGSLTSSSGTVSDGDRVDVVLPTSTSLSTQTQTSLTIDGVTRQFTVTTGDIGQSLLYFYGPHLTLAEESALGGDWASHQSNLISNRVNNWVWDATANTNYDVGLFSYYIPYYRGGASVADDKTDGDNYTTDWATDNPTGFNGNEAHRIAHSLGAYYLINGSGLAIARRRCDDAEWLYESGSGSSINPSDVDWTQRVLFKELSAVVMGKWHNLALGEGGGVIVGNYTGGISALAADYMTAAMGLQESGTGRWPDLHPVTFAKPWQDALILNELCLYHKNFAPTDDALFEVIRKGVEWLWNTCIEFNTANITQISTTSNAWGCIYIDTYVSGEGGPDGAAPDLGGMLLFPMGYMFSETGDPTYRDRLRFLLRGMVASGFYAGDRQWSELNLGACASYYDQLSPAATPNPVCTARPAGSIGGGTFTITSDGTWSNGTHTATEYEIWRYKFDGVGTTGIFERLATSSSVSVSSYSGSYIKGRVRKQNASGWGCWSDTELALVP